MMRRPDSLPEKRALVPLIQRRSSINVIERGEGRRPSGTFGFGRVLDKVDLNPDGWELYAEAVANL
jgi:hypothetical protein